MCCVLFCSREKDGQIHSEDVIIIRLPCFGLTGGQKNDTHTKCAHTDRAHIHILHTSRQTHTNRHVVEVTLCLKFTLLNAKVVFILLTLKRP